VRVAAWRAAITQRRGISNVAPPSIPKPCPLNRNICNPLFSRRELVLCAVVDRELVGAADSILKREGQAQALDWKPVTPTYVASVIERYPEQRASILELARRAYGHVFVRRVLSVKGGKGFTEEDTQELLPVRVPDEQAGV
jgi:hypothetical protein